MNNIKDRYYKGSLAATLLDIELKVRPFFHELNSVTVPLPQVRPFKLDMINSNTYYLEDNSTKFFLLKVSQFHAQINYKDDAFFLTDLSSQHGTWITK
jgi:hypothetical protein